MQAHLVKALEMKRIEAWLLKEGICSWVEEDKILSLRILNIILLNKNQEDTRGMKMMRVFSYSKLRIRSMTIKKKLILPKLGKSFFARKSITK